MNRGFIFITTAICVSSLPACDAFKDKYDAGYDDGWAAGYNTIPITSKLSTMPIGSKKWIPHRKLHP